MQFVSVSFVSLMLLSVAVVAAPGGTNRYNVLLIAIDDLRGELGWPGASGVQTPNIDRLAGEGVAFNHHYTAVPTCGASRYALLTGRSPASTGVTHANLAFYRGGSALDRTPLPGAQSLPELFRRSGYHTVNIGKISHTPDGKVYEYDGSGDGREEVPHAWDELGTPYGPWERGWGSFFAYAGGEHREDGQGNEALMEFVAEEDDDLPDGIMATAAIDQLARLRDGGKPFFLGVGFFKPHLPFVAPRKDWDAVADWGISDVKNPERVDSSYWSQSGEFYRYAMPFDKTRPLSSEDRMKTRRAYFACVRYVDRQVGRLLDALDENGLVGNTIVVLWSDHGFYLGEHEIWGKHTTLERASNSPLIIRAPEVERPGRRSDALVEAIDLFPTLVELARPVFNKTVHPLDGRSLVPILRNETGQIREGALTFWRDSVSVRTASHRLIATAKEGEWRNVELYDLSDDLDAAENVVAAQPDRVESMLRLLGAPR